MDFFKLLETVYLLIISDSIWLLFIIISLSVIILENNQIMKKYFIINYLHLLLKILSMHIFTDKFLILFGIFVILYCIFCFNAIDL